MSLFLIRPIEETDKSFVFSSWLKRYRDAVSPRLVTDAVFYKTQHQIITEILKRPNVQVLVACNPEDPGQIYGYTVAEKSGDLSIIHWTYVKGPFRRFQIASSLLAPFTAGKVQYTHRTHLVKVLDKSNKAVYNPALIWSLL